MPKLYLIATCQTASLVFLAREMARGAEVWSVDYLDHSCYREEEVALAEKRMAEADFILAQRGGFGPYRFETVKQAYPGKTFSLATIYFRGLHPDSCYVGHVGDHFQEPSLYHSLAVLEAFRQGRSEGWAVKNAFTIDNFDRLGLLSAWESSLSELEKLDRLVDFPIGARIDAYCRENPGFLTFNHPTFPFLHQYLLDVFQKTGLPAQPMNLAAARDPLREHDVVPLHDFVAEHYELPYRASQHWFLAHTGKFVDREDMIRASYAAYRRADPERLTVDSPDDLVDFLRASPLLRSLAPSSA